MSLSYNLNNLNSIDFEKLIQAIVKKMLGNGTISFGPGTDGGREAIYRGKAPFPGKLESEQWDGYWVMQAKFKESNSTTEDYDLPWIEKQLRAELEKYKKRKIKVEKPDNYLLFTNVAMSGVAETGGIDKAQILERSLEKEYDIKHIKIIPNIEIQNQLTLNRDVATTYLPFIMSGDVLSKLLDLIGIKEERQKRIHELICRFLTVEFKENNQSKLEQAGKFTEDKVNLEKVFVDLSVGTESERKGNSNKFTHNVISLGNNILKENTRANSKFVLVAGPGFGKSTLTQFITQIYRAYFLSFNDNSTAANYQITSFINESKEIIKIIPKWGRLPFYIVLKDYAAWIKENKNSNPFSDISLLNYIRFNINRKSYGDLTIEELEKLLVNFPNLFIYDGLDEVPTSSNRAEVLHEISLFTDTILKRISSDSIIIATTRPQGYFKEFDAVQYRHLSVCELNKEECQIYLNRLLNNIIEDGNEREGKMKVLLSALDNEIVSRLMKSPLQASIMAILVKSGGEPPKNKFDLFTDYYQTILKREKQRGIARILSEHHHLVTEVHIKLGYHLQSVSEIIDNPSSTITLEEFKKLIEDYLTENGFEKKEKDSISKQIIETATDRLVFISELQEHKYGFAIRSLQEYFAALAYVKNIKDSNIEDKIRSISKSAYWSNTLLFAFGYLTKEKRYLVPFIEHLANELNGSTDSLKQISYYTIPKLGSWLALDILNEGILSAAPKDENTFCKLLEPLFNLPPNKKHKEFSKLNMKLIDNNVSIQIENALKNDSGNKAAWIIAFNVYQNNNSKIDELLDKYWVNNKEAEISLLTFFAFENLYSKKVFGKFLDLLYSDTPKEFFQIFGFYFTGYFLEQICKEAIIRNIPHELTMLKEILFLTSTSGRHNNTFHKRSFDLILGGNKTSFEESPFHGKLENMNSTVSTGYTVRFIKPKLAEPDALIEFRNQTKNLEISKLLFDFFDSPSMQSFNQLNDFINKKQKSYAEFIQNILSESNSFMKYIYQHNISNVSEVKKALDDILSITVEKLQSNSVLTLRRYFHGTTLSLGTNMTDKCVEFYKRFKSTNSNEDFFLELNRLVFWSYSELDTEELTKLTEHEDLKTAIISSYNYLPKKELSYEILQPLLYLLSNTEIINFSNDKYSFDDFKISGIAYELEIFSNQHSLDHLIKKIDDCVNVQILTTKKTNLSRIFLYQIMIQKHIRFNIDSFSKTINNIINSEIEKQHELITALIVLYHPTFNNSHFELFKKLLLNNLNNVDEEFESLTISALNDMLNTEDTNKVFLLINENIHGFSASFKENFYETIRAFVLRQPSNTLNN